MKQREIVRSVAGGGYRSIAGRWLLALSPFVFAATAWGADGRIEGVVSDPAGNRLVGVVVALYPELETSPLLTTSGDTGEFVFEELSPGVYTAVAAREGYQETIYPTIELADDATVQVQMTMLFAYSEEVFIEEKIGTADLKDPRDKKVFPFWALEALPLPTDQFVEALPLIPGVVRGPNGRLNFNGARASQSIMLVNGSNVTDPLTGAFAVELPLKAVETVEVHTLPYSAEFGTVTAAVTNVVTRAGGDKWDVDFGSLWPSLRFRDGTVQGINSATPRVQVSGPLKKGKAWISQGFNFRFVRSRVYDVTVGADEQILESWDSFTQLDFKLGNANTLTTTFSYFPVEVDNWGIDTLHPEDATPDFNSWGWNFAVSDKATTSGNTLFETTFAVKSFDVAVRPKGEGAARLTPSVLDDNYFNEISRQSMRYDFNFSCTHAIAGRWGSHLTKFGTNLSQTSFDGTDRSGPIDVVGEDGSLLRMVDFLGDGVVGGSDVTVAGFIQDQWRPTPRLGLDFGLRYDFERITGAHHLSPRLSVAFSPWEKGNTIFKGGIGVFYGHVPLHVDSFEHFQERVETRYGADGNPVAPPFIFQNRTDPDGLGVPRATTWNVEFNQALGRNWMLRVNYRERSGSRELVVDRVADGPDGPMLFLSSRGESMGREFDVTLRKSFPDDGELFFSYSKARTTGDLNNFSTLYRDQRQPLLLESEYSLESFDVPHRILLWGILKLPKGITLVPGLEWRTGFPYTVFREDYTVVGERNRGGRFPTFFSADLRLIKQIKLKGRRVGIGFQLFNFTNHYNPRDITTNLASSNFGELANSRNISASVKFQLGF